MCKQKNLSLPMTVFQILQWFGKQVSALHYLKTLILKYIKKKSNVDNNSILQLAKCKYSLF